MVDGLLEEYSALYGMQVNRMWASHSAGED
jgi:hypothetical protein